MTDIFLERLKKSSPTVDPEDSQKIFKELMSGSHPNQWVIFSSVVISFQTALILADGFVGTYSEVISTDEMSVPSEHPMSVFGADTDDFNYIGLLYSNGAVMYVESKKPNEEPLLFIFLDISLVKALKIPYLDVDSQRVFNATEEQLLEVFAPKDVPVDQE
jgi:hypothetical protein